MGTSEFAVSSLACLAKVHDVVGVFTQPPKPFGRGYQVTKTSVHLFCDAHGFPVYCPDTLRDPVVEKQIKSLDPDLIVVVSYGKILPKEILGLAKFGCINVHASILPKWRGAAPIQRAIIAGDKEIGVSIMQMDQGLDTGAVFDIAKMNVDETASFAKISSDLAFLGADTLLNVLAKLGSMVAQPQVNQNATYAEKIDKQEGFLDFSQSIFLLKRKMIALNPWPSTWFVDKYNTQIKILDANFIAKKHNLAFGSFVSTQKYPLMIACSDGFLVPILLQKSGGKKLKSEDFLRGYSLDIQKISEIV